MKQYTRLMDVLDRVESGPFVEESDWDMKIVPNEVGRILTEFNIKMPPVGETIVPQDDALADRLFEAGLALAERVGAYCVSTNRRLQFTRGEILAALEVAPIQVTLGEGLDQHTEVKRRMEDKVFPTIKGGCVGTPITEEFYLQVMQSYAQESLVDAIIDGSLESIYGREIRSHSPWELLAAWHEVELVKRAAHRAGRPGIGIGLVEDSVSEIGEISATSYGGARTTDWHHIAMISEFKTDYMVLSKVAHMLRTGSIIHAFYNTIYGGSCGGRDGMALAIVGGCILLQMLYMTPTHSVSPAHPFYDNDTTPEIIQAISLAQQSLARNSRLLTDVVITPMGGPGTKTLLYEVAALACAATASGACGLIGPRSESGIYPGHVTGLEARFMAEVARATAGMSRGDADGIVRRLVALYQADLGKRGDGLPFNEAYDPITVKPRAPWLATYEEVKGELKKMGLPLR